MRLKINLTASKSSATSVQNFVLFAVKYFFEIYKNTISLILILFITGITSGQNNNLPDLITELAEELTSNENDPEAASMLVEELSELYENPVNINSGTISEISRLFFLSDFQIKSLADYIKNSGDIVSIYEIAAIPGFDQSTAEITGSFVSLEKVIDNIPANRRWKNTLLTNMFMQPGKRDTTLAGSKLKFLTKYKILTGPFEGGFTIEKDQGEKFFDGSPSIPDFLSAHLSYTGNGVVRRIIIGDFSARFGQGANINTGIRTGLSLTSPGYMSARNDIRPYTSTDENNFFRGVAVQFNLNKFDISLFYSSNKVDAIPSMREDSSYNSIVNLYRTGLHTTSSQIEKKDILSEADYGVNLSYNLSSIKIGLTWSETNFSLPFSDNIDSPEKQFDFNGRKNDIYSFYYKSIINKILLYGEISANNKEYLAVIQGLTLRPSDRLTINLLYRYYGRGFTSFHGNGPGISSLNSNEKGLLGNFTFEAAKHLFISAGCDISYYPWLKYRSSFPSLAKRNEIRIRYLPSETIECEFLFTARNSMFDSNSDRGIAGIYELNTRAVKGSLKYTLNNRLTMMTRLDYKIVNPSGSKGMMLVQDLNYHLSQLPITIWFRYCLFTTDDWDSRLYAYENDLLYSFSIPALSGKGSRRYLMAKWNIGKFSELRIKYGLTTFLKATDLTEDKDEIKFQFRIWL
jgi:opacity protein-like surface antigen